MIIIIISGVITVLAIIMLITKVKSNSLTNYKIKLDEVEAEIETLLNAKLSLLTELQEKLSERESDVEFNFLCNLEAVSDDEFKLNTILNKAYKELKDFLGEKRSFIPDDDIKQQLEELYQVDIECIATKEYYNNISVILNNKIKKFPNNIIAKFKRIKKKELYNDPIEEEFEILKKK